MVWNVKVEFDEFPPNDFDPQELVRGVEDLMAMLEYKKHLAWEKWIQIETAKIIHDSLHWCYRIEGVNDYQLEATHSVG
ncbi:hypothetical protein GUJ93_ZPchr0008g12142 [Zizania palustris]|uniref:Uncharacterized protein n=1 Tax=Zizania palustris TaxID=103762 RepID=A0A8J5VK24_ZIZPA|nr:hypothetical protein GUJ93_ZPchr0008g12142 [Zizania palustris]